MSYKGINQQRNISKNNIGFSKLNGWNKSLWWSINYWEISVVIGIESFLEFYTVLDFTLESPFKTMWVKQESSKS